MITIYEKISDILLSDKDDLTFELDQLHKQKETLISSLYESVEYQANPNIPFLN